MVKSEKADRSLSLSARKQLDNDNRGLAISAFTMLLMTAGMTGLLGSSAGVLAGLLTGMILLFCRINKKGEFPAQMFILLITVIYCIFQRGKVFAAGALIYNDIVEKLATREATIILTLRTDAASTLAIAIPLGLLLAETSYLVVMKAKPLAGIILLAGIAGLLTEILEFGPAYILLIAGCLLCLCEFEAGKVCMGEMRLRMLIYSAAGLAVLLMIINTANLTEVLNPIELKSSIKEDIHKYRYESAVQPLPEGDFSRQAASIGNDLMLEVRMEEAQPMYLRGFVGETYTKDGWHRLKYNDVRESRDIAYLLQQKGFDGQTQLSQVAELLGEDKEHPKTEVDVKVVGACREYCFVPYGIENNADIISAEDIGDAASRTHGFKGQNEYSYSYIGNLEGNAYEYGRSLSEKDEDEGFHEYMKNEAEYRAFVYEHYLEVPDAESNLLSEKIGVEHEDLTTYEAKAIIRKVLEKDANYSIVAGEKCMKPDFLEDFLKGEPGNSVQYASTAVLMLRECGIPARYVEGYAVSPEDYGYAAGEVTAKVSAGSARAWAEYYEDGVGWIPFDTVPMYKDMLPESKWQNFSAESLRLIESAGMENGATQAGQAPEGGSGDSREEHQNPEEVQETTIVTDISAGLLMLATVLLILLIAVVVLVIRRNYILNRRRRIFIGNDTKLAINAMFAHSIKMMQATGFERENNQPFVYCEDKAEQWFGEYVGFTELARLNEEALFSHHKMCEENRNKMSGFLDKTKVVFQRKVRLFKKLKYKWISCFY